MGEQQMHQIGEVADTVGLSLRTIRYYEEADLVPPSGRSSGGFRLYTDADIERLRIVKQLKPLDLTLDEMRDLLTTRDRLADPATLRAERAALVDRMAMFAALVEERLQRLRKRVEAGEEISRTLRTELDAATNSGRARGGRRGPSAR